MPWQGVCPMELRMRMVNALVAEGDSWSYPDSVDGVGLGN